MKIKFKLLAGALVCFLLVFEAGACDLYCYSCSNCTVSINAAFSGKTICLNDSIISNDSVCIKHPVNFSGKVFDCRNHTVNGTGAGYGFYIFNQNNVSIINCGVENYDYGIYLFLTSNSTITGNSIKFNRYGVYIDSFDTEELKLLDLINEYRKNNSVNSLSMSPKLTISAKAHSQDMANHDYFLHNSSRDYVNFNITPFDRMKDAGYTYSTYLAENIAAGYPNYSAEFVFNEWKNSTAGHNKTMLNGNFTVIGIGRAYNINSTYHMYWTNDFGGYNDTSSSPFRSYDSKNNELENNVITMNDYGIFIYYSNNTEASSNFVYFNNVLDFNLMNSTGNHGNDNTCSKPDGWNDDNKTGCSYVSPIWIESENCTSPSDGPGPVKDVFDMYGPDVCAYGNTLETCDIWVCNDTTWNVSKNLTGIGCVKVNTVSGAFDNITVMSSSKLGGYDLVLDCNLNGIYDNETDALDDVDVTDTAGFYIYPESETLILLTVGLLFLIGFMRFKKKTRAY